MKRIFAWAFLAALALLTAACKPAVFSEISLPEIPEVSAEAETPPDSAPVSAPESEPTTSAQAEAAPVQSIADSEAIPPFLPYLTVDHQGYTYGPGELVVAVFEGFSPWEDLSVNLTHSEQGIIKSGQASSDEQGVFVVYHPVQASPDAPNAHPAGELTFRVRSSTGNTQAIRFTLDYTKAVTPVQAGCGMYPPPPRLTGTIQVIWCSGFDPAANPVTTLQVMANDAEIFRDDQVPVISNGLAVYILDILEDDPPGQWSANLGGQVIPFEVRSP